MKKLFTVLVLVLALNFIAVASAGGWLWKTAQIDKAKILKIKEVLFPPPPPPPPDTAALNASAAATRPTLRLDEMIAKMAGRSATEQIDFIQHTFDAQMLQLDRRQRELMDLQRQVDLANQKLAADRANYEKQQEALTAREREADRLETDKGFQDTLSLYNAMPAKQVKSIFMTLSEATVQQYMDAMEPRVAAKIIKEFKTPEETAFIQRVLERIRQSQLSDGKSS
jgi:glutaredoxin 2